jgi:uncharacterized phage-associated protein
MLAGKKKGVTMSTDREMAAQAIHAVLRAAREAAAHMTRTKVAKLLYLADLEAAKRGLEVRSGIEWKWLDYGPFETDLYAVEDQLVMSGAIDRKTQISYMGTREFALRDVSPEDAPVRVDDAYWEIVRLVVSEHGRKAAGTLRDMTYQTVPMLDAVQEGTRGVVLWIDQLVPPPSPAQGLSVLRRIRDGLPEQDDDPGVFDDLREEVDSLHPARAAATRKLMEG